MNLVHEKIEYIFTYEKSENDAIMIGLFSTVIDNAIKNLIRLESKMGKSNLLTWKILIITIIVFLRTSSYSSGNFAKPFIC